MPRRRFFFRNLGSKALALAIALAVWFALSSGRRERTSERSYRIPLSLVNVPARTIVAPSRYSTWVQGPWEFTRTVQSKASAQPRTSVWIVRSTPPGVGQ